MGKERELKIQHIQEQDNELKKVNSKLNESQIFDDQIKQSQRDIDDWKRKSEASVY